MIDIDTDKIADIIRHVAATEVMPRYNNLKASDVREKNPGDVVTVADEASEKLFTQLLGEALPGSLIVGEEAVSKDVAVLNKFKDRQPVWIIDPIDGTHNFMHGKDKFGILISLVQGGKTQYAWAFDILGNRMAIAQAGAGTFINGQRQKISDVPKDIGQMVGRGGKKRPILSHPFKEFHNQRCSLHDCMDFLTGTADFIANLHKVTPWDHGATTLLAAEAGGYAAMDQLDKPYDPTLWGRAFLLIAPDRAAWSALSVVLLPKQQKN